MAESVAQVTLYSEALLYLLTGLGFIINVPKSVTSPTQQIGFLGLFNNTPEPYRGKAPPYKVGGEPDFTEGPDQFVNHYPKL